MSSSSSSNPIIIAEDQVQLTPETYRNAFRTKALLNVSKKSNLIKMKAQKDKQLKQIQPLGTWLVDFVQFPAPANTKLWTILFCEFNSRFLVPLPTNPILTDEAYEDRTGRMLGKEFVPVIEKLVAENGVKKLIGDADRTFLSRVVKETLNRLGVKYEFERSSLSNHIHTSILDRAVRTLRDMLFNLKLKEVSPTDLRKIAHIFNTTKHATLTKILGFPATPLMLHKDPSLQLLFIRRLRSANWLKVREKGFILPDKSKVFVRANYGKFDKKRADVEQEPYEVMEHEGTTYLVENPENGEELVVPRRDLAPRYTWT